MTPPFDTSTASASERSSRGAFITFEGVEGAGKSTQLDHLEKYLNAKGYDVLVTREPGGTQLGEAIRSLLLDPGNAEMSATAELFLYQAARAQHVAELIRPALEAGTVVLCDRFSDSTTAYQGAGRGVPLADVARLHAMTTGGTSPALTVVIDVPAEVGLARASQAGHPDRIERESVAFHERVRAGFLQLAELEPERVKVVNGNRPVDAVAAEVVALVDGLLGGA